MSHNVSIKFFTFQRRRFGPRPVRCDICNVETTSFNHHMRTAHPGCGGKYHVWCKEQILLMQLKTPSRLIYVHLCSLFITPENMNTNTKLTLSKHMHAHILAFNDGNHFRVSIFFMLTNLAILKKTVAWWLLYSGNTKFPLQWILVKVVKG